MMEACLASLGVWGGHRDRATCEAQRFDELNIRPLMHIHCLGINHQSASVGLRERLSFTPHSLSAALSRLGCGEDACLAGVQELVILSTCNRTEIYAVSSSRSSSDLESFLSDSRSISRSEFAPFLYHHLDDRAAEHLLRVAAGLDSQVLGEPQILGQVAGAYHAAHLQGTTAKILSRLFQSAVHAGKRSRAETTISHNPASIASVAVNLIGTAVRRQPECQVAVLGAGEMAELAVESLRKRGVKHIRVVNRTRERADQLASRWGGASATFEDLAEVIAWCDVLIASTGAPHALIHQPMVEAALAARRERPLVIMDIAVPRDVDDQVAGLPGVHLYDLDALTGDLQDSLQRRQAEIPKVEAILSEELQSFLDYQASLDVLPLILQLRHRAESIRLSEVARAQRKLSGLSPEDEAQIDALTRSIIQKILHHPTVRLRQAAQTPLAAEYADLTRSLFGLDEPPAP
jgi:glutamyl-tRNA reductase